MKLLIDMNLSPEWVPLLEKAGWPAVHWVKVGQPDASDQEILGYARSHGLIIFTHDLDSGAILAATKADCPSVIQLRTQDVTPGHLGAFVITLLHQFEKLLEEGALIIADEKRLRARILPL